MAQVFLDASFSVEDDKTGFGFPIVDGVWIHAGSHEGFKVSSPKEVAARAILWALRKASIQG